ncbi:CAP domain-containing protein [Qipengyuania sediminis]|uniref:CAP domain-containing protein n=1 Tax=Qipengyuania sediminis TaxID=1532023 RepID=UPI00197F5C99|nr:CAP domain-containing protein [Qipengyuania sediminis]
MAVGTGVPPTEIALTHQAGHEAQRLLALHNAERARVGLPALRWNPALARDAGSWAEKLLQKGKLHHASADERSGHGENLWMGTAGAWDADGMVNMFLEERRYFRPAAFPHVSLTGNWSDVGHYSQIVWRDTREVGCAKQTGNGVDVLVCRYYPAGNVMGRAPF